MRKIAEANRPHSQVFANYSSLSSGPPINIAATELRGITIEQLSSLQLGLDARAIVDFVSAGIMRAKSRERDITSHNESQTQLGTEVGLCRRHCLQLVRSTPFGIRAAFVF